MKHTRRVHGAIVLPAVLVAACLLHADPTRGMMNGITGYSGKQGDTCNDSCHSDGVTPVVRFEGPTDVTANAIATFRFIVESQSVRQIDAGFNVAASDGVLQPLPGQDEHFDTDELTQDSPKANVAGLASWDFTWQAPSQPGTYTLYGAGLSANGNEARGGDDSAKTTLTITVVPAVAQPGDANCDGRAAAADVIGVEVLLPAGVPGDCPNADVNGDGVVDESDLTATVGALFTSPSRN